MAKLRRRSTPSKKSIVPKPKAKPSPAKAKARPVSKSKVAAKSRPVPKPKPRPKPKPKPKPAAKRPPKAPSKAKVPSKAPAKAQAKARAGVPAKAKVTVAAPTPAVPPPPVRRSTYVDAVATYERGVQFLQARKYKEASEALKSVIAQFPEEKELHERALLYIKVCEARMASMAQKPESAEDRVYAATLAINNGALDQAIAMLSSVLHKDPEYDQAAYMLGVAHALRGNTELALQSLARSMALNHENRDLAFKEPDLEGLRRTDEMRALLASPPAQLPRKDRAPSAKPRR